jgi:hypothetical protein
MGSPKLEGLDDVTQNFCSSVHRRLLISFLFFLSLYSWMIPKFLKAGPIRKNRWLDMNRLDAQQAEVQITVLARTELLVEFLS